jgi:hypothetical protein
MIPEVVRNHNHHGLRAMFVIILKLGKFKDNNKHCAKAMMNVVAHCFWGREHCWDFEGPDEEGVTRVWCLFHRQGADPTPERLPRQKYLSEVLRVEKIGVMNELQYRKDMEAVVANKFCTLEMIAHDRGNGPVPSLT